MKKRFSVLMTRGLHVSAVKRLEKKCNVVIHSGKIPIPKKILMQKINDVDGLVCHPYDTIDKDVIKNGKNLKAISTFSVGFDHIDVGFAKKKRNKGRIYPQSLDKCNCRVDNWANF